MKFIFRNCISNFSSYIEIFISLIIMVGVILASFVLINDLINIYNFFSIDYFEKFLGFTLVLIIGVELIKMLSRHTPGSAIEVLLFALARKLIINENNTSLDFLMGVIAIAILFLIRKYFVTGIPTNNNGIMVGAATTITNARRITGLNIPEGIAQTIGGLVSYIAQKEGRNLSEGEIYKIDGITMSIGKLRDGIIEVVEFFKEDPNSKK